MRECPWLLVMSRWLRAFILIVLFERTNYNDKNGGAYGLYDFKRSEYIMGRYATTNKLLLFRRTYFSIGGTIMKADNLASILQICLDSGAKKVLLLQTSAVDLGTVPAELMSSFSLVFYQSAEDAVFRRWEWNS